MFWSIEKSMKSIYFSDFVNFWWSRHLYRVEKMFACKIWAHPDVISVIYGQKGCPDPHDFFFFADATEATKMAFPIDIWFYGGDL